MVAGSSVYRFPLSSPYQTVSTVLVSIKYRHQRLVPAARQNPARSPSLSLWSSNGSASLDQYRFHCFVLKSLIAAVILGMAIGGDCRWYRYSHFLKVKNLFLFILFSRFVVFDQILWPAKFREATHRSYPRPYRTPCFTGSLTGLQWFPRAARFGDPQSSKTPKCVGEHVRLGRTFRLMLCHPDPEALISRVSVWTSAYDFKKCKKYKKRHEFENSFQLFSAFKRSSASHFQVAFISIHRKIVKFCHFCVWYPEFGSSDANSPCSMASRLKKGPSDEIHERKFRTKAF